MILWAEQDLRFESGHGAIKLLPSEVDEPIVVRPQPEDPANSISDYDVMVFYWEPRWGIDRVNKAVEAGVGVVLGPNITQDDVSLWGMTFAESDYCSGGLVVTNAGRNHPMLIGAGLQGIFYQDDFRSMYPSESEAVNVLARYDLDCLGDNGLDGRPAIFEYWRDGVLAISTPEVEDHDLMHSLKVSATEYLARRSWAR